MSTDFSGIAERLRQIEDSAREALAERQQLTPVPEVIQLRPRRAVVPVPRRGRVFLRHGEGHGAFSTLTLTSPHRPHVVAPS